MSHREKLRITPKQLVKLIDMFVVDSRLPEHCEDPNTDIFEIAEIDEYCAYAAKDFFGEPPDSVVAKRIAYCKQTVCWYLAHKNPKQIELWQLIDA